MTQAVEVRGLRELARALPRFTRALERDLPRAGEEAAQSAAGVARSSVPRRSGALAASIAVVAGDPPGVGLGTDYGGWVEFGGTRGRPYVASGRYFLPAARSTDDVYQHACEKETDRAIGGFPWPRAQIR